MSGVKGNYKFVVAIAAVLGAGYFIIFHWNRFVSDFYPLDKSTVAPNILASIIQYAILLVAAYLLYPPVRRAIDKYVKNHVNSIKQHISDEHDALHEKLDHIIKHHPSIPDEPKHGNGWKERPKVDYNVQ